MQPVCISLVPSSIRTDVIYLKAAIVYRIVRVTRNSVNRSGRLHQTWRIIAESGALYTLSTTVNLIATVLVGQDNSYELFQAIADPIVCRFVIVYSCYVRPVLSYF